MGKRKGKAGRNSLVAAVSAVILIILAALFLTLNDGIFKIDGVPTWNEIFSSVGLRGEKSAAIDGDVTVHFIDVGQGDSELIKTPSRSILIDSGESDYAATVIDYLRAEKIERLDMVVVTHPHSDHAGGMDEIIDKFKPQSILMPKITDDVIPTTETYYNLLGAIKRSNVSVMYAEAGTAIDLGDNCRLEILAPVGKYEDLNNWSVVTKLVHGENSFLFVGDIEKEAETDIVDSGADLSADVLKIAHHGSSTSSKKNFLKAVMPEYGVIEVGSPNSYNHPNEKTVERLESFGIKLYRTDICGNIVFASDGKGLTITTEKTEKNDTEAAA